MASGLLSLKWNNHRSTFFHILSTIRSKESYCDVTLACDGKFYPVHKLVLSTCSDYFDQMFERTNCKHPIIVLKDIRSQELEALLNYMYVGEVNVLQNELAGLIKAAECLMIKGLAVPDEAPAKENKRTYASNEESPLSKRRKRDEEIRPAPSQNQQIHREPRESSAGNSSSNSQSQRQSSSASIPNASPTVPRVPPNPISPSPSAGSASESLSEEVSQPLGDVKEPSGLPNAQDPPSHGIPDSQPSSQPQQPPPPPLPRDPVPEVILDEPGFKEEPQDIEEELTDTKEIFQSQDFEHPGDGDSLGDKGSGGAGGATSFESQLLASQPQSMEDLVAQAIPGSSGLQGNNVSLWEGEGSFPMEGFTGDGTRPPQMRKGSAGKDVGRSHTRLRPGLHRLSVTHDAPGGDTGDPSLRGRGGQPMCKAEERGGGGGHPDTHPGMGSLAPLNLQMYTVSGAGSGHACFLCGKTFGLKHNLYRHLRTHTGERPHQCPHCEYRGSRRSHVLTHINRVHQRHDHQDHQDPDADKLA